METSVVGGAMLPHAPQFLTMLPTVCYPRGILF